MGYGTFATTSLISALFELDHQIVRFYHTSDSLHWAYVVHLTGFRAHRSSPVAVCFAVARSLLAWCVLWRVVRGRTPRQSYRPAGLARSSRQWDAPWVAPVKRRPVARTLALFCNQPSSSLSRRPLHSCTGSKRLLHA